MGNIKLTSPCVTVYREGYDPLTVQTANPDLIRWDETAKKHKWGKADEVPMLWLTFVSWAAARRTGALPGDYTFDTWKTEVLEVQTAEEDDDDEDGIGTPTPPGPEPG